MKKEDEDETGETVRMDTEDGETHVESENGDVSAENVSVRLGSEEGEKVVDEVGEQAESDSGLGEHERRHQNETKWVKQDKNVMVFSRAGKPIYSSNGDELELSSLFSLLQAMLAKTDDRLRVVRAGKDFAMVFSVCGPLLLAVASRLGEPVGYLQLQLEYIYAQILFHFTLSALEDTFRRKPGYDLRSLLGGARTELEGITDIATNSPSIMLEAVSVLPLPVEVRTAATNVLYSVRQPNVLYAILIADTHLVTYISPKRHPLKSSDLILLINFVKNARQLKTQETWTPLCLPGFNTTGFLHAYAAYVSENICLLMLTSGESLDQFHFCSEAKTNVMEQLKQSGVTTRVENALSNPKLTPGSCDAASSIHLIFRSLKQDQYFETTVATHAPLHQGKRARSRLISRYVNVSERLHSYRRRIQVIAAPPPSASDSAPSNNSSTSASSTSTSFAKKDSSTTYIMQAEQGEIWDVRDAEAVIAVINPGQYEVYAAFHIFTTASQAMACATRFAAWVRSSKQDLFLLKPPTW